MGIHWIGTIEHNRWLAEETNALLRYARSSAVPSGFGWIGEDGLVDTSHPVELWITGRMTFAFSIGTLLGIPGCGHYADHGVRALAHALKDHENGGWWSAVGHDVNEAGHASPIDPASRKECYQHAFVLLAAATATAAGRPGAAELLDEATAVQDRHWWDSEYGLPIESYAADFTEPEDYRGINAAMHTVEALLVTADVTGEDKWLERAIAIVDFAVNKQARNHGWRLPEHYDTAWRPLLDYNEDQPAHPFRPYGVTPGHGLEWSRLTVQAHAAVAARALPAPEWMLQAAQALFARAHADGWNVDGAPGFVYTTDFEGRPIVHERMHWVACEAISAAASIRRALMDAGHSRDDVQNYEDLYRRWLDYVDRYVIEAPGVWRHELDASNRPSTRTWAGHPDVYHALQATLMSRLPVWPAMCKALAEERLDT